MNPFSIPSGDDRTDLSHCLPPNDPAQGQPLTLRHVRQLTNAEAFASAQGHPLTVHATFHLRLAEGFTPERWSEFQTSLFDKMSRWLQRQGLPVAFLWTRENGPRKGPHVHCLLHLPQAHWAAFKRFMLSAGRFQACDAGGEAIVISAGLFGMMVPRMRAGALRYLLKSLEASASTLDALGIRHGPTKPVALKRCGVSTSIAQQARKEAGWEELKVILSLHDHLHPANDNLAEANLHAA